MDDPGYTSYQDPRLQPPEADDDLTPVDCWEACSHAEACRMQLARLRGWYVDEDNTAYWMNTLAADLGWCDKGRM